IARRHERANDKVAALKAHLVKETQTWQQLTQSRDEQLQQLKVKLLLSESDAKGHLDQAQKIADDSIASLGTQAQVLQNQVQEEQRAWQQQAEAKDAEIHTLKEDLRSKVRKLEADYTQRLGNLGSEKEALTIQLQALEDQYHEARKQYEDRTRQLSEEQAAL